MAKIMYNLAPLGNRSRDSCVKVQDHEDLHNLTIKIVVRDRGFLTVILYNMELMRLLWSRVTVYLPRSLSCANYWNKLNDIQTGVHLWTLYRLWITIILNITYLIIRISKCVDTKSRVNLWTFFLKNNPTSGIVATPPGDFSSMEKPPVSVEPVNPNEYQLIYIGDLVKIYKK